MRNDTRIPLALLPEPEALPAWLALGGPAALLTDLPTPPEGSAVTERFSADRHRIGCACCGGRSPAALALDRLYQARVRGRSAWFDRAAALLSPAGRDQLREAMETDVLTRARFRPDEA